MSETPADPDRPTETTEATQLLPAGWYPDPEMVDTQRFWDGTRWSEHRGPAAPAPVPDDDTLVAAGWIAAVLFPPAGLVLGVILAGRRHVSGIAIVIASLILPVIVGLVLIAIAIN